MDPFNADCDNKCITQQLELKAFSAEEIPVLLKIKVDHRPFNPKDASQMFAICKTPLKNICLSNPSCLLQILDVCSLTNFMSFHLYSQNQRSRNKVTDVRTEIYAVGRNAWKTAPILSALRFPNQRPLMYWSWLYFLSQTLDDIEADT